jgi:hypothetical protein
MDLWHVYHRPKCDDPDPSGRNVFRFAVVFVVLYVLVWVARRLFPGWI